ncbi:MAG: VTT domain-containing protein [Acidobacteria bacterium]|nr:VTT domain-containing protein [Acidobacteriota bacterium]
MSEAFQFLLRHGYAVLFGAVFAEQIGLPLPAIPVLLAAGALAGMKRFAFLAIVLVAVLASLLSDLIWYALGRRRGHSILNLLCRISLEPDSCVRRTEDVFARHGVRALVVAKFIPGLNTAAPPLAGMFRMRLSRFLLWDGAGALLWAGTFCGAGYLFSAQLERVATSAGRLGGWLVVLVLGALAAYISWKYIQRRRFIRQLRTARVTPEELMRKLEADEEIVVVDLRHSFEFEADSVKIPGSLHMLPEELNHRHTEIPRDREVVLYCT